MGKTNPTYRQVVQRWVDNYDPFKRALRRQHREPFEEIMSYPFTHASPANALNDPRPSEPILVSICLEQQRRIRELQACVEDLETEVVKLGGESVGTHTRVPYEHTPDE